MITTRVGNDAPGTLLLRQRCNLVVSSPQLEGTDGLLAFEFEKKLAVSVGDQFCPGDNATEASLGFTDVAESDYGSAL
jgi:hypothetical protein